MLQSAGAPASYSGIQISTLSQRLLDQSTLRPLLSPTRNRTEVCFSAIHGLGVFARRAFTKGDVVEIVPSVVMFENEFAEGAYVQDYVQEDVSQKESTDISRLDLGAGAIFNSSRHANVCWAPPSYLPQQSFEWLNHCSVLFVAIQDIEDGEELVIKYGWDYWFSRIVEEPITNGISHWVDGWLCQAPTIFSKNADTELSDDEQANA